MRGGDGRWEMIKGVRQEKQQEQREMSVEKERRDADTRAASSAEVEKGLEQKLQWQMYE